MPKQPNPPPPPGPLDTTGESQLPRGGARLGRLAWVGLGVVAGGAGAALLWWIVR